MSRIYEKTGGTEGVFVYPNRKRVSKYSQARKGPRNAITGVLWGSMPGPYGFGIIQRRK
jgi:hypothetical protein